MNTETSAYEDTLNVIQTTIKNISNTNNTPSSDMVDVLLDLQQHVSSMHDSLRTALAIWQSSRRIIDFYEESYGPVTIPDEWVPAWRLEAALNEG